MANDQDPAGPAPLRRRRARGRRRRRQRRRGPARARRRAPRDPGPAVRRRRRAEPLRQRLPQRRGRPRARRPRHRASARATRSSSCRPWPAAPEPAPCRPPATARACAASPAAAVRDILALTERPGVISLPAGSPSPSCSTRAELRAAFTAALGRRHRSTLAAVLDDRGRPELRGAVAALLTARGLPTDGRRRADHQRLAAGADARRGRRCSSPATSCSSRSRPTSPRCRAFQLAGARVVPVAVRRRRPRPRRARRASAPRPARTALHGPDDHNRPDARCRRAPRRDRRRSPPRAGLWIVEDDPYDELRYRRRAASRRSRRCSTSRTGRSRSRRCRRSLAPGLRIGWVRAPRDDEPRAGHRQEAADLHTSTVDQSLRAGARCTSSASRAEHLRPQPNASASAGWGGAAEWSTWHVRAVACSSAARLPDALVMRCALTADRARRVCLGRV